jgi:hypothetical protein
VEVSTELADKDYEIEFYSNSIEELQKEINILKASGIKEAAGATFGKTTAADPSI